MTESEFIEHASCPKCLSRDNLGIYSDGHAWCFGCHYYIPGRTIHRKAQKPNKIRDFTYPDDASNYIPSIALNWLFKYGIDYKDLKTHNIQWSPSREWLLFPFGSVGFQARSFKQGDRKYYTFLKVSEYLYTIENNLSPEPETVVLVEDLISAIKVGRVVDSMPLFGSHASISRLEALRGRYSCVVMWLDHDKWKEAVKASKRAQSLGLESRVIKTDLDPKEYSEEEIKERLLKK